MHTFKTVLKFRARRLGALNSPIFSMSSRALIRKNSLNRLPVRLYSSIMKHITEDMNVVKDLIDVGMFDIKSGQMLAKRL